MQIEDLGLLITRYILAFHLIVCILHFTFLIHLLVQPNSYSTAAIVHDKRDDAWVQKYLYVLIVVLYHAAFDIYRLVEPHAFFDVPFLDDCDQIIPPTIIFLYLFSYAIRISEDFPSYPPLGDIVFTYFKQKTAGFNATNWRSRAYAVCISLRIFPHLFLMLLNFSTYIFADTECTGYFICIYSWEHWFQLPLFFGWAWRIRTEKCGTLVSFLLVLLAIFVGCIPFLFLDMIVPLALFSCLFYESLQTSVGLIYLSSIQEDVPDSQDTASIA